MKIIKESINNLKRHRFISVATIVSISLILVIFNVLITVNQITKDSISELANKINYSIYLTEDATSEDVEEINNYLNKFSFVKSIDYIGKEEALKKITEKYPENTKFLEDFEIENPLPQSLKIHTENVEDHAKLEEEVTSSKYNKFILRSEINNNENQKTVVENLIRIKSFSTKILLWMIITFITAGGLIIFNALKTTLFSRRNEIQIMQFVGATYKKIMLPFLAEGAILGLSAFIIGLLMMVLINQFLPLNADGNLKFFTTPNVLLILTLEAVIAVSIGILTSIQAVNNYLKSEVIFDD